MRHPEQAPRAQLPQAGNMVSKLAHAVDAWLWRQGLGHPVIMPVVRNELLLAGFLLLVGGALFFLSSWPFWFAFGLAIMAITVYSLSRFFLKTRLDAYSGALLMQVLVRWLGRLLVISVLVWLALVEWRAPVTALAGGVAGATMVALVTYAVKSRPPKTGGWQ